MEYLEIGCRVLLSVVFGWSVFGKVRSRAAAAGFTDSLTPLLGLLPVPVPKKVVAGCLLVAEAAVVVLPLPVPVLGLALACALLAALTGGVAVVVGRGLSVACRCFGASAERLGVPHLVRNTVLLSTACGGLGARLSAGGGPVEAAGVLVATATAAVAAVLLVRLDDLIDLFAPRA